MSNEFSSFTNHTGGAYGVDTMGCYIGLSVGFKNHVHLRPENNTRLSKKLRVLMMAPTIVTSEELDFAKNEINRLLGTNHRRCIASDLKFRNYYQVSNSEAVFCFAPKISDTSVSGGTDVALQLAIKMNRGAYVFDTNTLSWFTYNDESGTLCSIDYVPTLTQNYAIVGTRDVENYKVLNKKGEWAPRKNFLGEDVAKSVFNAIVALYEKTIIEINGSLEVEE